MYYFAIPTISFTDVNNKQYLIKDMREYPAYTSNATLQLNAKDMLDEIASRPEVYGDGGEVLSYKLAEANIVALMDNNFDLSKLKRIVIPV